MALSKQAHTWANYPLRLPEDLKRMLTAVAHQNNRSLNAEIIHLLRQSLDLYRR